MLLLYLSALNIKIYSTPGWFAKWFLLEGGGMFWERLSSSALFEISVLVWFLLRVDSVSSREEEMTFKVWWQKNCMFNQICRIYYSVTNSRENS